MYNALTLHHFETAANAGVLTGPATQRGAAGSRAQGTWVQFDLQWDEPAGESHIIRSRLRAVRFQAFGCPHVIAVADWIAQQAVAVLCAEQGAPAKAALPETVLQLKERFAVPTEKLGRLLIIEDAWIAAFLPSSN